MIIGQDEPITKVARSLCQRCKESGPSNRLGKVIPPHTYDGSLSALCPFLGGLMAISVRADVHTSVQTSQKESTPAALSLQ
jgi:hypothetical protein